MISSVFRKTGKIKNPHSGDFPFLHGSSAEETKGISTHHDLLCPQRKKAHSLRMIGTLFPNNEAKSSSNKAIHPHTGRHRFLLTISIHCGPPWSVRRLTAKYGMSYLTYFIAFMHRFHCTFCAHFFHNSEFQQIIVVIYSFFLLAFSRMKLYYIVMKPSMPEHVP